MRSVAAFIACLCLAGLARADPPWELKAQEDGVDVYTRSFPGSEVKEVKSEGKVDSPPAAVWAVIRDVLAYPKTMPYTKTTAILGTEQGGKVTYCYQALGLPIVSDRDYTIKLTVDHTPQDGSGLYRVSWVAANDYPKAPPPLSHYVRLSEVSGYWELTPLDGGKATHAVYYVHSDPASPLPNWILNKANTDAIPKVWQGVRAWSKKEPYASAK